jgi:hypothetical protein
VTTILAPGAQSKLLCHEAIAFVAKTVSLPQSKLLCHTKQPCLEQKQFALPQIKLDLSRNNRVWNKNSLLCHKPNLICHEAIAFGTKTV